MALPVLHDSLSITILGGILGLACLCGYIRCPRSLRISFLVTTAILGCLGALCMVSPPWFWGIAGVGIGFIGIFMLGITYVPLVRNTLNLLFRYDQAVIWDAFSEPPERKQQSPQHDAEGSSHG